MGPYESLGTRLHYSATNLVSFSLLEVIEKPQECKGQNGWQLPQVATLHQYIRLLVLDPFHPKQETFTAVHLKFGKRSRSCCQVSKTGMGLLAVEHVLNTDLNNCVCKHVAQVTASFNCVSKPLATCILSFWICFSLCVHLPCSQPSHRLVCKNRTGKAWSILSCAV